MRQGQSQAKPAGLSAGSSLDPDAWGGTGESHISFRDPTFSSFPSLLVFLLVCFGGNWTESNFQRRASQRLECDGGLGCVAVVLGTCPLVKGLL